MKDLKYYMSQNYRKTITEEEGVFFVEVPDLPGCVADGDTPNEAFNNIREAMEAWVTSRLAAGLPVPEPRSASSFSGKFVVRVPKSLHRQLSEQAEQEVISLNQYVVSILSKAAGGNEATETYAAKAINRTQHLIGDALRRLERLHEIYPTRGSDVRANALRHHIFSNGAPGSCNVGTQREAAHFNFIEIPNTSSGRPKQRQLVARA
jgi:antitoxin HicB